MKDYLDVTKNDPELSDLEVCKLLRRDKAYKAKYGDYNIDALRKLVRHARSPKYNLYLRHPEMRNPLLQKIRDGFERRKVPWDEMLGKQIADVLEAFVEADGTGGLAWRQFDATKGQTLK
jgi:hypothetical protein